MTIKLDPDVPTIDPQEAMDLRWIDQDPHWHLVQQNGCSMWSFLGTEPDHRTKWKHEQKD